MTISLDFVKISLRNGLGLPGDLAKVRSSSSLEAMEPAFSRSSWFSAESSEDALWLLEDWQAGEMKPESPLRNGLVLEVKMPEAAEAGKKIREIEAWFKNMHFSFHFYEKFS